MAMKCLCIFLFSVLLTSTTFGDEREELRKLVDKYADSVNRLDLTLATSIWSQSAEVTFIQPRGHQKGWDQVRNNFYLGAMNNFSQRDLKVENLSIQLLGDDSAWGEFYWEFNATFKKDGQKITSKGRETQVWKKESDGWKIVHVHYSNMPVTGEREGF